jgi:amino acid adenylation domain-containing protein
MFMLIQMRSDRATSPRQREIGNANGGRGLGTRSLVLIEGQVTTATIMIAVTSVIDCYEILRTARSRVERVAPTAIDQVAPLASLQGEGPLLHIAIATLQPDRHAMVIAASALIADARSIDLLVDDVAHALCSLERVAPPEERVPFAAVAAWQHELQTAEEEAPGRAYWSSREPVLNPRLPCGVGAPDVCGPQWASARIALDGDLAGRAAACAAATGVSVDAVFEAVWRMLHTRISGDPVHTVGVLVDGREGQNLRDTLGPLARVLPITVRVEPGHDLRTACRRVAAARAEAIEWQDAFPGSPQPLVLGIASAQLPEPRRERDLTVRVQARTIALSPSPLQLICLTEGTQPSCLLQYDMGRIPATAVRQLAAQYGTLLASTLRHPSMPLRDAEIVGPEERELQLRVCHAISETSEPTWQFVHERIADIARERPNDVAVAGDDGELSYAALDARANQLAHYLRRLGAGPEVTVGVALERGVQIVAALLGILKSGAAYVALEAGQPRERLRRMMSEARIRLVVTTSQLAPQLAAADVRLVVIDTDAAAIAAGSAAAPTAAVEPANLAYVMFTSGSTGWPKGVAVEHRQLAHYVQTVTRRLDLQAGWRYATVSTFAADLGLTMVFGALCAGGTLHVVAADRAADAECLAADLHDARIDCLKIVPSHLNAMLGARQPAWLVPTQRLVLGGESASWSLVRRLAALRPACAIFNHYGPTETTVGAIATRLRTETTSDAVPLGHPLEGVQAFVVDDTGRLAPIGAIGELYLGGATVTRGYLHRPGDTARRYVPDGISGRKGARLYRTGDLARVSAEGMLEFCGRRDQQVKFHGHRIELGEIREALLRHPMVRDAVALVAHDRGGTDTIVAYYVAREEIDAGELRACVAETVLESTLPGLYVHLHKLPLTPNGKIDRGALPSIDDARARAAPRQVEPRTTSEHRLAAIWAEALGLTRVGVRDNFFQIGGHSLIATRVISKVREAFHINVPFRALFDHPTIEGLAAAIDLLQPALPDDAHEMARLVEAFEQLPVDEAERLLADDAPSGDPERV